MSSLPEIEDAISQLNRKDFQELSRWFDEQRNLRWDEQMEGDARPGGPLDRLAEQALAEYRAGKTLPLK